MLEKLPIIKGFDFVLQYRNGFIVGIRMFRMAADEASPHESDMAFLKGLENKLHRSQADYCVFSGQKLNPTEMDDLLNTVSIGRFLLFPIPREELPRGLKEGYRVAFPRRREDGRRAIDIILTFYAENLPEGYSPQRVWARIAVDSNYEACRLNEIPLPGHSENETSTVS
jgi:hypothetical protein